MYEYMIELTQQDFDERVKKGNLDFKCFFLYNLVIKGKLKNADFRGAKLLQCQIQNVNFSGSNLSECVMKDTDFRAADFSKCNLKKAEIEDCNFSDTNWKAAYISQTVFKGTLFENCSFEKVYFSGGEFDKNVMMKDCNFARAYINSTCFDMPPANMQNPQNYETMKLVKGGIPKEELENYKRKILQLMENKQAAYSNPVYVIEQPEKKKTSQKITR